MIFEALYEAVQRNELLLMDGGMCHYHRRRDGTITIREIISTRAGAGSEMLARLHALGLPLIAKCPADLAANDWYARRGFVLVCTETTKTGRAINVWRHDAPDYPEQPS